jgi:hypothetical protein
MMENNKIQCEYDRLQIGIGKVAETRAKVADISIELEKKKVLMSQLQRECEEFLDKLVEQKTHASERERVGQSQSCACFIVIIDYLFIASTNIRCAYWRRRNPLSSHSNSCS